MPEYKPNPAKTQKRNATKHWAEHSHGVINHWVLQNYLVSNQVSGNYDWMLTVLTLINSIYSSFLLFHYLPLTMLSQVKNSWEGGGIWLSRVEYLECLYVPAFETWLCSWFSSTNVHKKSVGDGSSSVPCGTLRLTSHLLCQA